MLIVGDVASNYYNEAIENPNLEIIALNKDIAKIKEELNLKEEPIHKNFISKTYKKKNKLYTLHTADNFLPLKKVLSEHILSDNELRVASPTFQCVWARMKCNFIHKDVFEWEKNVMYYNYFNHQYKDVLGVRDNFNIKVKSNHLSTIGALAKDVNYTNHSYSPYDTFKKGSLFTVFTSYDWSIYLDLVQFTGADNIDILSKPVWDRYDYTKKLDAVVEKATVDACNEYIIPNLKDYVNTKQDVSIPFKKSLMNLCSLDTSKWFSAFILKNYEEIMSCMDEDYVDILLLSIKSKQLKRV